MTNNEKFTQSISDIVGIIYDLTGEMEQQTNFDKIEEDMVTLDKLTTILKRMGDTVILEKGEEVNQEKIEEESNKPSKDNKVKGDVDVNK